MVMYTKKYWIKNIVFSVSFRTKFYYVSFISSVAYRIYIVHVFPNTFIFEGYSYQNEKNRKYFSSVNLM